MPHEDCAVSSQHREEIGWDFLVPVHLIVLQCGCCGGSICNDLPLDPLKLGGLAAAGPFGRLPARHVAVELLPGGTAAWDKLLFEEAIWTGANDFIDCFER